ncbi:hypothetical protein [Thalassospira sp. CH_XMU1448-2]|uniref:hypothetical protein n=1 Tax=Thalassospira sp. CH_XMU1448-2 TaxID=3107773 RepID=UPI003008FA38
MEKELLQALASLDFLGIDNLQDAKNFAVSVSSSIAATAMLFIVSPFRRLISAIFLFLPNKIKEYRDIKPDTGKFIFYRLINDTDEVVKGTLEIGFLFPRIYAKFRSPYITKTISNLGKIEQTPNFLVVRFKTSPSFYISINRASSKIFEDVRIGMILGVSAETGSQYAGPVLLVKNELPIETVKALLENRQTYYNDLTSFRKLVREQL